MPNEQDKYHELRDAVDKAGMGWANAQRRVDAGDPRDVVDWLAYCDAEEDFLVAAYALYEYAGPARD